MLFVLSKIFWLVASPGNFCALLILAGLAWFGLSRHRRGLGLVLAGGLGLAAFIALPLGHWLLMPLEARFPVPTLPAHIDGIVVLGGSVRLGAPAFHRPPEVNGSGGRMLATADLARRYPEARILVTGGNGTLETEMPPEAQGMRNVLRRMGVDPARVEMESQSRNTHENALYSQRQIQPKPGETWVLITSAWHLPRAVGCFRDVGWTVIPYPADYRSPPLFLFGSDHMAASELQAADLAIKEWIGLLAYRILGWTDALYPAP